MNTTTESLRYRQPIKNSDLQSSLVQVGVGKYVLTHQSKVAVMRTLLGSCVGVIGHKQGFGFMAHVFSPGQAREMLRQLQLDVQREVWCVLEDFQITITGGNRVCPELAHDIGKMNIDAVLDSLDRSPDTSIHLWKDQGNVVQLLLDSGNVQSRKI